MTDSKPAQEHLRPARAMGFPLLLLPLTLGLTPGCSSADGGGGIDDMGMIDGLDGPGAAKDNAVKQLSPGFYLRPARDAKSAVLVLQSIADDTLNLNGVELRGQARDADIDLASGFGILVSGCRNLTIKGGTIGGYKGCIVIEDSSGVTLDGINFDGWYGQRLRSTEYSEDVSDWLEPHENDRAEWLVNYGGAISVTNARDVTIKNCRGRRGQNGILLTSVTESSVYDNDFSFLSGWGLGMYRSSDNVVSHNVFDYCVRGYSHDVYWRGQDSAGILMFESCSGNLIARNSATHGGDGVFLYAGNDLVKGESTTATGSDGNIFFENDLRYAVANSFEGTFSKRNAVLYNNLSGSHQHGIWGGYSSEMVVLGNEVDGTLGGGITIEHGQNCLIADNRISNNEVGVELYWDEDEDLKRTFGARNETRSRDHWVLQNKFTDNVLDVVLSKSTGIVFHANEYVPGTREPYFENVSSQADPGLDAATVQRWLDALDGAFPSGNLSDLTLNPWIGEEPPALEQWRGYRPPAIPGSQEIRAEARDESRGGLETIIIGEWGPWDFRSGARRPAQRKPGGLLANSTWQATWFRWELNKSDPRTAERAWRNRVTVPIVEEGVGTFTNPWATDEIRSLVGNDFFGLFATTTVRINQSGKYALSVDSDDGIRVLVDDRVVIEDWSLHASKRHEEILTLDRGDHTVRIEYFQVQGAAALVVSLSAR